MTWNGKWQIVKCEEFDGKTAREQKKKRKKIKEKRKETEKKQKRNEKQSIGRLGWVIGVGENGH